jgi:hypothetical protein
MELGLYVSDFAPPAREARAYDAPATDVSARA